MRQKLIVLGLFIIGGILVMRPTAATQVQAQGDGPTVGCDDAQVIGVLADTTAVIDYRAACAMIELCYPGISSGVCQFTAFRTMLEQCPPDDRQCHDGAMLLAAAILYPNVAEGLAAFWQGDDATALAIYQQSTAADYPTEIMLPLSRAILYQRLNQPAEALAEYDRIFAIVFSSPLVHYARLHLYAELGRLDEASFDALLLANSLADRPEFAEWVAALQAQYPLDETKLQDWWYFPISSYSNYVVTEVVDGSLVAPSPVRVGIYADIPKLVLIENSGGDDPPIGRVQVLRQSDDSTSYVLEYPDWDRSGTLRLTQVDEQVFHGVEEMAGMESNWGREFMLAAADVPDPRELLSERRHCEDGVLSRVTIGSLVTSISYGGDYPLQITDVPGGEVLTQVTEAYRGYVTVIGGPECVGSVTWWEGYHDDGTRGWFAENIDTLYNINPTTYIRDDAICNGVAPALPMRLSVNTTALVVPDLGANNVRREPSVEAELLGTIPPNAQFEIIGGPVCLEDTVWWYADYDGLVGWTVEGQVAEYWLAPVE